MMIIIFDSFQKTINDKHYFHVIAIIFQINIPFHKTFDKGYGDLDKIYQVIAIFLYFSRMIIPCLRKYSTFDADFCVGLILYVIVERLVLIPNGVWCVWLTKRTHAVRN